MSLRVRLTYSSDEEGGDGRIYLDVIKRLRELGPSKMIKKEHEAIEYVVKNKDLHADPKVRKSLQKAYNKLVIAFLEFCLDMEGEGVPDD
jgi:hypothetical protein